MFIVYSTGISQKGPVTRLSRPWIISPVVSIISLVHAEQETFEAVIATRLRAVLDKPYENLRCVVLTKAALRSFESLSGYGV